jgi:hypothetical protein
MFIEGGLPELVASTKVHVHCCCPQSLQKKALLGGKGAQAILPPMSSSSLNLDCHLQQDWNSKAIFYYSTRSGSLLLGACACHEAASPGKALCMKALHSNIWDLRATNCNKSYVGRYIFSRFGSAQDEHRLFFLALSPTKAHYTLLCLHEATNAML